MIFTAPMKLLAAVVLEHDSDAVTRELLRQGTLDFVSVKELSGQLESRVDSVTPKVSLARTGELRKRVEGFINLADPPIRIPELSIDSMGPVDLDAMDKALDAIGLEINGIRERQKGYQEEILKLEEIRRQVEVFDSLKAGTSLASAYSFLSMQTGMVLSARLPELEKALESFPCVVLPSEREDELHTGVLLITMKRDDARVNQILAQHGWEDVALPAEMTSGKAEAVRDLEGKIETLRAKQRECASLINTCLSDKAERLGRMWTELRVNELFARIQSCFSRTSRTLLFSGWIPKEKQKEVETGIRGAAGGRCYLEWISPEEGEAKELPVPVEMRNPEILRPFQNLVTNYAVPEYGTIDPTPFVAVAYLAMFGLMFGDAGHGLVILLIGIIGTLLARKRGKKDNLFRLITYCGGAAIVTGVLFGSYFGNALFPPLWFDYHGIISGHAEHAGGIITELRHPGHHHQVRYRGDRPRSPPELGEPDP
jgi:V/A-type H+-transporting ATPase subunit I